MLESTCSWILIQCGVNQISLQEPNENNFSSPRIVQWSQGVPQHHHFLLINRMGGKKFWMDGTKKFKAFNPIWELVQKKTQSWKKMIYDTNTVSTVQCTQTHLKLGQRLQSAKATFGGDGSWHHPTFGLHTVKVQCAVHCCMYKDGVTFDWI